MKEAKEMMIKLPMVTATSYEELNKARIYPQSGRYIVKLDNGDVAIADVTLRYIEQGEARPIDEDAASYCTCFVGQPVVLDPDEWVLAIDLENAKLAYEADRKRMEEQMREANDRTLAQRRSELEQEYEMKKLQLELDTPKRFAQGEWVSGKTLTEIIRTLTAGKKED